MNTLKYGALMYNVDHAVKGVDYIHGYDADGNRVVAFDGVTDFEDFEYTGTYLAPEACLSEACNTVKHVDGQLVRQDGAPITEEAAASIGAATATELAIERARVDGLIEAGANVHPTTCEIDNTSACGNVKGTITSNGAYAYIKATLSNVPSDWISYTIPLGCGAEFAPLISVRLQHSVDGLSISIGTNTSGELIISFNTLIYTGSIPSTISVYGGYPLASTYIPELEDAHIGFDGTVHPTTGAAIRTQVQQAMDAAGQGGSGGGSTADAVLYTKQNLSENQKSQARENVGACKIDDGSIGVDAWSSKNTIDKLCPTFTESGTIVTCEPVEGYPLEVTAEDGATITRCGKNIMRQTATSQTINGVTFTANGDGSVTVNGTCTATTQVIVGNATFKKGLSYVLTGCPAGGGGNSYRLFAYVSTTTPKYDDGRGVDLVTQEVEYTTNIRIVVLDGFVFDNLVFYPMIRPKSVENATYEPYKGDLFAIGENVPALPGVNTLWAGKGIITVTGKADPTAIIEKRPGSGAGEVADAVLYTVTDYGISTEAEDNTPALQALVDSVSANGGGIIFFPVGVYNFKPGNLTDKYPYQKTAIMMPSNVSIIGENIEKTVLKQVTPSPYSMFRKMGEPDAPITGCAFSNFTVDAYDTGDVNAVYGKAFFFQYVRDCVFRDLILRGTVATAMGIDFLDRVVIDNVSCIDCGRTFTGAEAGTSGIGIGTAGWENENFIVTNCICDGCGQYGIFIENQGLFGDGNVDYAKGCIISNCIVRNGLNKGIGVRGGQNVTVIGCETYENASHGIYMDNNCKDVKVISCSSAGNSGCGIYIAPYQTSSRIIVRDCHFVDNADPGMLVATESKNLCLLNNYTDGNKIGLSVGFVPLDNCAIKGNIIFDGESVMASFNGNTEYNDFVEVQPDNPEDTDGIAITAAMYTEGKKIMPDGSVTDEASCWTTLDYIDVSELPDSFVFYYGVHDNATMGWALRIAQYDADKNSLSNSFSQIGSDVIHANTSVNITKLAGCKYIRLFASKHPLPGVLTEVDGIAVTADMYTEGKKIMPDGSLVDETGAYATADFIDVSSLADTFYLYYGEYNASTVGNGLRIAQYDTDKTSLGSSFGMVGDLGNKTNVPVVKLDGCKYIRIFSSYRPTVCQLVNSVPE